MNSNQDELVLGLPRRPRVADASWSTILWAIAGGLIAGPPGALIGGAAGNAIAQQRQPLEMAVREYLTTNHLEVLFYYPGPRAVKVTFRYDPTAYWTVESALPGNLELSPEDRDDWLYGNLIARELPAVLRRIQPAI
jgi:hypothetical protein